MNVQKIADTFGSQKDFAKFLSEFTGYINQILTNHRNIDEKKTREIIYTCQTDIKDGKVYTIDHHGELHVKRLYRMPGGKIHLSSYNKDEYPNEPVTSDEIRILGKARYSGAQYCGSKLK